jgi:hypothetical protein
LKNAGKARIFQLTVASLTIVSAKVENETTGGTFRYHRTLPIEPKTYLKAPTPGPQKHFLAGEPGFLWVNGRLPSFFVEVDWQIRHLWEMAVLRAGAENAPAFF